MSDWRAFVTDFYKQTPEEQTRRWSQLTADQQAAFLKARQSLEPGQGAVVAPPNALDRPRGSIDEELDDLVRVGEELLTVGSFSRHKRYHDYSAWRLRSIGVIRELGPTAAHLLPAIESRFTQTFYKGFAQQILGAVVAARALPRKAGAGSGQLPAGTGGNASDGQGNEGTQEHGSEPENRPSQSVFVVHGHDHAVLHEAARLIERLGLKPVVLFEEPSKGRTIIEKLEQRSFAGAALVILTPDDIGACVKEPQEMRPRARQNVILELGFFIGVLGRGRVVVLYTEGIELPSDYSGVEYVRFDREGAWKLRVARELRAAKLEVDLNRLE
ncbi:MAG TPA: nucleotide-binding protein [Thermoanaerobaculia bacterium]|nr:nucleotide-binding protein [Thermoanaerobaculia bacterium]